MGNVLVNEECLTNIANAIRGKCSTTCGYKPGEMAAAIESITTEAGDTITTSNAEAIIDRSITEYSSENITLCGDSAFYNCTALTSVDLPNCELIGIYAPTGTGRETGGSSFANCVALTNVNIPKATTICESSFFNCKALQTIELPETTRISGYAFQKSGLTSVYVPKALYVGINAFSFCMSLITANFPVAETIDDSCFHGSSSLKTVDLGACTSIGYSCFYECAALDTLIIRTPSMCSLGLYALYHNTPIANGTGYIYVPSALVDSYKADSSWSTYATQIRAIEDYPDITGG